MIASSASATVRGSAHQREGEVKDMRMVLILAVLVLLGACSPEVGSEKWCADMKAKPKGDWTANEAGDFAKHCIL